MSKNTEGPMGTSHRAKIQNELNTDRRHHSKGKAKKLLRRALWYAANDIPIYPVHSVIHERCTCGHHHCRHPGKHPRTPHGFKDATTDKEQIKAWWRKWPKSNIGIPTGSASGLLVLDVDPRHGGDKSLARLVEKYGALPKTAVQFTGGGGKHVCFRYINGIRSGILADGLEHKGNGASFVVSPSRHRSGRQYRWLGSGWRDRLLNPAAPPKWLVNLISRTRAVNSGTQTTVSAGVEKWKNGERNNRLVSYAGKMRRLGMSPKEIQAALVEANQQRCEPPLDETEVRSIAKSVGRYPAGDHDGNGADRGDGNQPVPFHVDDDGVFFLKRDDHGLVEATKLADRVEVRAQTRDQDNEHWGRQLIWRDKEGHEHQWAMPMGLLASDAGAVREWLLSGGLGYISTNPRLRERFNEYLQTAPVDKLVRSVPRIGWHGGTYVLPDQAIGLANAEEVLYQSQHDTPNYWNVRGTADDWREHLGKRCSGNSRLVLVVSCGFTGPVLSLVGAESGGVHFVGPTSIGKSTALMVGGSVCGGGGQSGFLQTWRTTINGLEAIAAAHNDGTLFLDELSQVDAREAADTAYLLGNSMGKGRMSRSIGARKRLSWTLLYVSSGETTLAEHAASAGKRTRGGAEVRLLNVDADAGREMGLFEDLHGAESADAFVRTLKSQARRYYGAPVRAFIGRLVQKRKSATRFVREQRSEFVARLVPADASGEVRRAAERFALIGAAGELATKWGLTGWNEGESIEAAERCFRGWLKKRGTRGSSDMEAAIQQIRAILQANGVSRFPLTPITSDNKIPVRDQAGFRRQNSDTDEMEYLVFTEIFKHEFCKGHSYQAVARELDRRGYLLREDRHMTIKSRLPGFENPVRVYCLRETILRTTE